MILWYAGERQHDCPVLAADLAGPKALGERADGIGELLRAVPADDVGTLRAAAESLASLVAQQVGEIG